MPIGSVVLRQPKQEYNKNDWRRSFQNRMSLWEKKSNEAQTTSENQPQRPHSETVVDQVSVIISLVSFGKSNLDQLSFQFYSINIVKYRRRKLKFLLLFYCNIKYFRPCILHTGHQEHQEYNFFMFNEDSI